MLDFWINNKKMIIGDKSKVFLIVASILALFMVQTSSQAFTALEMNTMLQDIDSYFFVPVPRFRVEIRKFLRAAFHDCMGGCDGSIKLTNTDNRGLQNFVRDTTAAYNTAISSANPNSKIFSRMSRADFWMLSAQRALGWGIKNSRQTITFSGVTYVYGRPAAAQENNSPNEPIMPNAAGNWSAMLANIKFGISTLTEDDIVTLFGLHSSGNAEMSNSGFKGPWGPPGDKNVVNNHFFVALLNYGFPQGMMSQTLASKANFPNAGNNPSTLSSPPPTNLYEWQRTSGPSISAMMLPIDMQIYLNFNTNSTGGQNSGQYCSQGNNASLFNCTKKNTASTKYLPLAKNAPLAFSYAQSNSKFLAALIPAFLKMVRYTANSATLTPFSPAWGCVNGVRTCLGDIFFSGCPSSSIRC